MTILSPGRRSAATLLAAGALHLVWLPWHAPYWYPARDGSYGPYETWQVAGLALSWVVLVVAAAWAGTTWPAARDATVGLVVVWCADNATRPVEDASLWPLGAMLLASGALGGGVLVARLTTLLRDRVSPPGSGSTSPPA